MTRRPTGDDDDEAWADKTYDGSGNVTQLTTTAYRRVRKREFPIGFDINPDHYKPRNKRRGRK